MSTETERKPADNVVDEEVFKLAPFNPSSEQIQEKAMELLALKEHDVLFDLGCGDGRLLVAAAKRHPGLRCVGVEIDPIFATRAKESIEELPDPDLRNRIHIREEDVLKLPMTSAAVTLHHKDVSELTLMDDASALYLFVLPKGIVKIMPLLEALVETRKQQGRAFRVLSYMFKIHDWEPTVVDATCKGGCPVYLYKFKADDAGN
jgi:SAM-dependent methyltransferase